jgi:hypothetical protein
VKPNATSLAAASLILGGSLAVLSCRDVVAGDATSAAAELCAQLASCYGDEPRFGCEAMEDTLRAAAPFERDEFLSDFDPSACLGTCPGSLACLDARPYCAAGACASELDCCGWSRGEASCDEEASQCCRPNGVECATDGDCCDLPCRGGFCGGKACVKVGFSCNQDIDCCSRRCEDGECRAKTCSELGQPCVSAADCCPPLDPGGMGNLQAAQPECDGGVCRLPEVCVPAGAECDPVGSACCDAGFACVAGADGLAALCGPAGCLGLGIDCGFDAQCCGASYCDHTGPVPVCKQAIECARAGEPCSTGCCSGNCVESVCSQYPNPDCVTGPCHSPCLAGGAMDDGSCADTQWQDCVSMIIAEDPYCRCALWDATCVSQAIGICACGPG